jgi:hypothetical protein
MNTQRRAGFAQTSPEAADPGLRGRTYAVPFDAVWREALRPAGGGLRGWSIVAADDQEGSILACTRGIFGAVHDVAIDVLLDADAQTRVDARVAARKAPDLGRSRRRALRFFHELDRGLAALPPSAPPAVPRPPAARAL